MRNVCWKLLLGCIQEEPLKCTYSAPEYSRTCLTSSTVTSGSWRRTCMYFWPLGEDRRRAALWYSARRWPVRT